MLVNLEWVINRWAVVYGFLKNIIKLSKTFRFSPIKHVVEENFKTFCRFCIFWKILKYVSNYFFELHLNHQKHHPNISILDHFKNVRNLAVFFFKISWQPFWAIDPKKRYQQFFFKIYFIVSILVFLRHPNRELLLSQTFKISENLEFTRFFLSTLYFSSPLVYFLTINIH
jgi:hypothetical protein